MTSNCIDGPCYPGNEYCGLPFTNAPQFHLMDQHGCEENDPNGPVFDPVHGVVHHFYQIHLAAAPGYGPDYGHFVSKDFVHWAALPVAIWNGLDSSFWPPKATPYDNEAIYTGSAVVVDGAAPDGKSPGIVNIYPGLCNKNDWPACETGTLLAQAVPTNYATDELLVNWSKPDYNPIVENTERDPSTPWQTSSGEWRLRTYDSMVYGAASSADLLAGKWYTIGKSDDFRTCECPSVYPLPAATPGTEAAYAAALEAGLPDTVHKTSCGGDWWQLGSYTEGAPKTLGSFVATKGWEDLFVQKKMDQGDFYASKDNEYPILTGGKRRINWGWAIVPPASTQSLPREITFNAAARSLQQYPIEEIKALRGSVAFEQPSVSVDGSLDLGLSSGLVRQSEILVTFDLPSEPATFGIAIGDPSTVHAGTMMDGTDLPGADYNITHYPPSTDPAACKAACDQDAGCKAWTYVLRGSPAGSGDCCLKSLVPCPGPLGSATSGAKVDTDLPSCSSGEGVACTVEHTPGAPSVPVECGGTKDVLPLVPGEKTLELRVFADWTFVEAYFQQGRVAITKTAAMSSEMGGYLTSTSAVTAAAAVYPMKSMWVDEAAVRSAPRVYK